MVATSFLGSLCWVSLIQEPYSSWRGILRLGVLFGGVLITRSHTIWGIETRS